MNLFAFFIILGGSYVFFLTHIPGTAQPQDFALAAVPVCPCAVRHALCPHFDNSFWGDEGFSIGLAQMNVFEMLQVTAADNHPPLYYLFTQLLYHLLGNHGYVYHLSALIPYGLILILACTVIFRQFGLIPAVVVSTFASLTDTAIMFNVEARMYSLGAFFVLAAYLALHNILHSGKTSDWVNFQRRLSLCRLYALLCPDFRCIFLSGSAFSASAG